MRLLPGMRTGFVCIRRTFIAILIFSGFFHSLSAATFYWVGGSGSWNNFSAHWATTSGGSAFYTRVPNSLDDVVFDANSFTASDQTVRMDTGSFVCRHMNWTGVTFQPSIVTNFPQGATLKVYGSLSVSNTVKWLFDGTVSFESLTTGNTIQSPAATWHFGTVAFSNTGEWTLLNDLSCLNLYQKKGVLKTNNYTINCDYIFKTVAGYKSLFLGTSQVNADTLTIAAPTTTLDADSATFLLTHDNEAYVTLANGKTYGKLIFPRAGYLTTANSTINSIVAENYLLLTAGTNGNTFKRLISTIDEPFESYGSNTYGYAEFHGWATFFTGNNTFDTLAISNDYPLGSIRFAGGSTQTITGTLMTTSSVCSNVTWLASLSATSYVNIVKASGNVVCTNLTLQNINATGGATFTAYDSYVSTHSGTGVTGWTVIGPTPKTLYWVGGSGNWSDNSHWSLTSGGPGGSCAGSKLDNVIFDENSFSGPGQQVTMDLRQTGCNNFTWTNLQYPVTFRTDDEYRDLNVYGDFTLDPQLTWDFTGFVSLRATSTGKTITTAGKNLATLSANSASGGWTLQDPLHVKALVVRGGTFVSNNQTIYCDNSFGAAGFDDTGAPAFCSLDLGTSFVYAPNSPEGSGFGANCVFNTDNATLVFGNLKVPSGKTYKDVTILNGKLTSTGNTFHKLKISGNASITGSNSIDTLVLDNHGKTLTLTAGTTQTINQSLTATSASCSDYITVLSGTPGSAANLVKNSGSVVCDYLILQDINASGGATFTTNNSIAMSNVSGWTMPGAPSAKTLYWVGGNGNWSDAAHWSLSSGGTGGACIPTLQDDVIFDGNSFSAAGQQVAIDATNVYCNNISWSGIPYATAVSNINGNLFNVYGSFSIASNVSWNYGGKLSFRSSAMGNTITTNGRNLLSTSFDGTGSWALQDDAAFTFLNINKGTFTSNNHAISCDQFNANNGYTSLYLGTSLISIPGFIDMSNQFVRGIVIRDPLGTLDAANATFIGPKIELPSNKVYNNIIFPLVTPTTLPLLKITLTTSNSQFNTISTSTTDLVLNGTGNTIHKLVLNGNATIHGSETYDSLLLNNPGRTIIFDDFSTHTINNELLSISSCSSGTITMKSANTSTYAALKKASGSVSLQAMVLQGIHAIGGASFTATNSTALANVTGWTITAAGAPRSLYWVGGSGNWSQSWHWALSSGGIGGNCLPTASDHVYFDENSFSDEGQILTIDVADAGCNDMIWTNQLYAPSVTCDPYTSHYISVYGSFIMDPSVQWDFPGRLSLKSTTAGKTITSSGVNLRSLSIDGTGSWTLQDELHCKFLSISKGTFRSNNNNITCDNFFSVGSAYSGLYLGTSQVIAPDGFSVATNTTAVVDADSSVLSSSAYQLPSGKTFNSLTMIPGSGTLISYYGDTIPYLGVATLTASNCIFKLISANEPLTFTGAGNTIRKMTVNGNYTVSGSNSYDTLLLDNPGDTMKLAGLSTQTITGSLSNTASCATALTVILSGTPGQQANISKASGTVTMNALLLKDIKALGGATFIANNSTALTLVTGWTINRPAVTAPGVVTGLANVCAYVGTTTNLTYSIDAVAGISSYLWTVPAGATIVSGQGTTSIDVNFTTAFVSGNVGVQSVSSCGNYPAYSLASNLAVTKTVPAIPASITGPANACLYMGSSSNATYTAATVANATSYNWTVPAGASIVSGQGTATVTVSYDNTFVSGNVAVQSVSTCGSSVAKTLAITKTLPTTPIAITGTTNVCAFMGSASNVTYTIAPVATATSYSWAVPAGASIVSGQGTTSIDVSYSTSFVSGNVSVQSVSACGSSVAKTLVISKVVPITPVAITGPANVCAYTGTATNVTYSIGAVANATSYSWTVPAGATIVSGQGTTSIDVNYSSSFTSGSVAVQSVSGCGSSTAKTLAITKTLPITPVAITGPVNACNYIADGTNATYTIAVVAGATSYSWTVPAGASIVSGQGTTSIDVNYTSAFVSGNVAVQSVANCGSSLAKTLAVTKTTPAVPVAITGSANVCIYMGSSGNATYTIAAVSGASSYNWSVPAGASIVSGQGTTSIDVSYSTSFVSGNVSVQSVNACASSAAKTLAITKTAPLAPALITGTTSVSAYVGTATNLTYSITAVANATSYNWTVPSGAAIVSGQGTTSISVNYSSSFIPGNMAVQAISGCGNSAVKTLAITLSAPAIPTVLNGPTNACPYMGTSTNATYSTTTVANATSYTWTVPAGASIVSGQGTTSINVSYSSSFVSGNVGVSAVGNGGTSTAKTLAITKTIPVIPVAITGASNACPYMGTSTNVTYSIAAVANATSYNWAVPAGATLISGQGTTSIDVNYSSSFVSGNISVQSVSGCGSSAVKTLAIIKTIPVMPVAITGVANVCPYVGTSSNVTYSIAAVANATSYNWTVPAGATIVSGQGTNSIDVNYSSSFASGSMGVQSVSGCGSSVAKTLVITRTVPLTPGTITGTTNVCPYTGTSTNLTYSIAAVAGAVSYNWTVPTGATIVSGQGTTSIDVNYSSSFVPGNISVQSVANCGSSVAKTLAVAKVLPITPTAITGPANVCAYTGTATNVTYSITAVANATSYNWVAPANATIVSGQGTTSIDVSFASSFTSGSISVQSVANCGSSTFKALTVTKTLPAMPVAISGPTNACAYMGAAGTATYSIAAVSGATSYNWTVPTGATMVSGQGTTSIEVSYATSFVSGNISVQSIANCGNSTFKTLAVTKAVPAAPAVINGPADACPYLGEAGTATYSVDPVANTVSYNWAVPAEASIVSGAGTNSIEVSYSSSFTGGDITVGSVSGCGNSSLQSLTIGVCISGRLVQSEAKTPMLQVNMYPNPTVDFCYIDLDTELDTDVVIEISDVLGNTVTKQTEVLTIGKNTVVNDCHLLRSGVYLVKITDKLNGKTLTYKMIKQ